MLSSAMHDWSLILSFDAWRLRVMPMMSRNPAVDPASLTCPKTSRKVFEKSTTAKTLTAKAKTDTGSIILSAKSFVT